VASDTARWQLRAAMDAVVAQGYRLTREEYGRILASFSHKSYKAAPELCLSAYDDLSGMGLGKFCRTHDQYFALPMVTTLAQPVSMSLRAKRSNLAHKQAKTREIASPHSQ
jgi:hypothetical protein